MKKLIILQLLILSLTSCSTMSESNSICKDQAGDLRGPASVKKKQICK